MARPVMPADNQKAGLRPATANRWSRRIAGDWTACLHVRTASVPEQLLKWIPVSEVACAEGPLGVVQAGEQGDPRRERGNLTPVSGGPGALPVPEAGEHQDEPAADGVFPALGRAEQLIHGHDLARVTSVSIMPPFLRSRFAHAVISAH